MATGDKKKLTENSPCNTLNPKPPGEIVVGCQVACKFCRLGPSPAKP